MCNAACPKSETKGPSIYRGTAFVFGGCTFCTRHITSKGEKDHDVIIVKAAGNGGFLVRFCLDCFSKVKAG